VTEENKDVVRTYMRAWETGDVDLMESVVAPGFTHVMMGRVEDRAGLLARVGSTGEVYSDVAHRLHELVAEGDRVACYWTMTARHTGPLPLGALATQLGRDVIEPTGATISQSGMFIAVIEDGRLVGGWGEYDRLRVLLELGAFDDPE
jgi:predicted ester cyclase